MSLINQVLLDLDQRHAPAGVLPLARGVLPRRRPSWFLRWGAALVAVGAGAGIVVATSRAAPSTAIAVMPVAPVAPVMPVTPVAPVMRTALAAPASVVAPAATPTVVAMAASSASPSIAVATIGTPANAKPMTSMPTVASPLVPPAKAIDSAPAAKVAMLTSIARASARRSIATPAIAAPPALAPDTSVQKRDRPLSARERADAEYQRGLALHQQGQAEAARAAFAAALSEDARHAPARQALAVALLADGRADEAETVLAQGLELQPREAQLASTLARIKADRHDIAGAIGVLKAALPAGAGTKADAPAARALLATLQQRNAEHAEAIENYAAALRLVPGNGPWWIGLGVSLAAAGRSENAREAFERARTTELTPDLARYVEQRLAVTPR